MQNLSSTDIIIKAYRWIGKTANAIPLSNGRNLYNEANYVRKTLIEDKCRLETEFVYTFTEADYLNAK